jgi:dihydroorotate dehydrogenase subfamily 1
MEILRAPTTNLKCEIFGRKYQNPVFIGSGSLVDSTTKVDTFLDQSSTGMIIPRTTRLKLANGREKHPSPHLDINYQTGTMRNSEWTGAPISFWRPSLEVLSGSRRVAMSVSGRIIEDCVEVCKELDDYDFPFLEINISCAHSNDRHGFITKNEDHIKNVVLAIKNEGIKTPISLKLGHSDFIVQLAIAAQEAGADAITAINTYGPIFDFDISNGIPTNTLGIAGGKGGLSGKGIFQIALTDVADLAKNLKIPIIACGGISTSEDIVKMLMAGASAVEIYTAAHLEGKNAPKFINKTIEDLSHWLSSNGYLDINSIKGLALKLLDSQDQMQPQIPNLDTNLCVSCGACENICLEKDALKILDKLPIIDSSLCIGCGACTEICPSGALSVDTSTFYYSDNKN